MKLVSQSWLLWLHCLSQLCIPIAPTTNSKSTAKNTSIGNNPSTKQLTEEYELFKRSQLTNPTVSTTSPSTKTSAAGLAKLPKPFLLSTSTVLMNKVYFYELINPSQGVGKFFAIDIRIS
jgi:hypothetical protein